MNTHAMITQAMIVRTIKFRALHGGMLMLLFAGSPCALADELHTTLPLKHNPFVMPAFIKEPAPAQSGDVAQEDMTIRGVLVSQKGTLININGSILGLHEFIGDYQLVSLDGEKAVLSKNGQEIVLTFPNNSPSNSPITSDAAGLNRQQPQRSNP